MNAPMTRAEHLARGSCCAHRCLNCPYDGLLGSTRVLAIPRETHPATPHTLGMATTPTWTPCKWRLDGDEDAREGVYIETAYRREGAPRFAIRHGGNCLNRDLEWELECSPSNRDDGFAARCRFATRDEAEDTYGRYAALRDNAKAKIDQLSPGAAVWLAKTCFHAPEAAGPERSMAMLECLNAGLVVELEGGVEATEIVYYLVCGEGYLHHLIRQAKAAS